jgi:O-methyltransferase
MESRFSEMRSADMLIVKPDKTKPVSIVQRIRRRLRDWRGLRKLYYKVNDLIFSAKDPIEVRLIPEERFSQVLRNLTASLSDRIGKQNVGDYLEFGVYNGTSLSCAYRIFQDLGLSQSRFFGFDSFEGMPSEADYEDDGAWMPGQCSCTLEAATRLLTQRGIDWNKVFLVKGWFSETLTSSFLETRTISKASVLMIDCDLYSSSLAALNFAEPLIKDEALVIFDDWHAFQMAERNLGEKRAFAEFLARHTELQATEIDSYNEFSLIFRVVRNRSSDRGVTQLSC